MYTLWFRPCWRLQSSRGEDIAISNIKSTMNALKTRWDNISRDAHGSVWLKGGIQRRGWDQRGNFLWSSEVGTKPSGLPVFRNHGDQCQHHQSLFGATSVHVFGYRRQSKRTHASDRARGSRSKRLQINYICVYIYVCMLGNKINMPTLALCECYAKE